MACSNTTCRFSVCSSLVLEYHLHALCGPRHKCCGTFQCSFTYWHHGSHCATFVNVPERSSWRNEQRKPGLATQFITLHHQLRELLPQLSLEFHELCGNPRFPSIADLHDSHWTHTDGSVFQNKALLLCAPTTPH
jgi:hypothetical protein